MTMLPFKASLLSQVSLLLLSLASSSSTTAAMIKEGTNNNNHQLRRGLQQQADPDGGNLLYTYLCDENDDEIKGDRPIEGGNNEIRVCIERGRNAALNDLYIMKINTFEFYKQVQGEDDVIQKVIDNGALQERGNTRFANCERGRSLCSFTTLLKAQFFEVDGTVKGIGNVALQNGFGEERKLGEEGEEQIMEVSLRGQHEQGSGQQREMQQDFAGIEGVTLEFAVEDGLDKKALQTARWRFRDHWTESEDHIQALYITGLVVLILLCFCFCIGIICWRQCCADVVTRRFRGEKEDDDDTEDPIYVYTEEKPRQQEDLSETHSVDDELDISEGSDPSSYDLLAYEEANKEPEPPKSPSKKKKKKSSKKLLAIEAEKE